MNNKDANGTRASSNRNEVTLGIMGEKISNIEKSISEIKTDVKEFVKKIDDTYATRVELIETQKELKSLESNISWGVKIVIGAVILAVLGLVVNQAM